MQQAKSKRQVLEERGSRKLLQLYSCTVVQATGRDQRLTYCVKEKEKIKTFMSRNTGEGRRGTKICA